MAPPSRKQNEERDGHRGVLSKGRKRIKPVTKKPNDTPAVVTKKKNLENKELEEKVPEKATEKDGSLLFWMNQLRAENALLEKHVMSLEQTRDHLITFNRKLANPLVSSHANQQQEQGSMTNVTEQRPVLTATENRQKFKLVRNHEGLLILERIDSSVLQNPSKA